MPRATPVPVPATTMVSTPAARMTLEQCTLAWLDAKASRSASRKTATAYHQTLADFRETLARSGHDLDSAPHLIALAAQGWAGHSKRGDRVTPNTYNQRLSILSSFYTYAIKHEVVTTNPITRVERRVVRTEHAAQPLPPETVTSGLAAINRETLEGKRDYALLCIALSTGRRVSELAGLRSGHLTKHGTTALVRWVRCKGNQQMTDTLPQHTTTALYDYLCALYGAQLGQLPPTAPVWVSFSNKNHGQPISIRTIQRICHTYLHTSKAHATRHTWAVTMHKQGATLAQIGRGLGHRNLKTTSDYLQEQLSYDNPYACALEEAFGI
jgi:site-specific recombinase XerD